MCVLLMSACESQEENVKEYVLSQVENMDKNIYFFLGGEDMDKSIWVFKNVSMFHI